MEMNEANPTQQATSDPVSESPVAPGVDAADQANQETEKEVVQEAPKTWKLKINNQEEDVDEKTLVKYAQLGKAGYRAMERAAETEKKAKAALQKMYEMASKDPNGLIKIFNPDYNPVQNVPGNPEEQADPRDRAIQDLQSRLAKFEEKEEQAAIESERKLIDQEFQDATKDYAWKNSNAWKDRVYSLYRKFLDDDYDVSMEDVAFYVNNEWKAENESKNVALKTKLDEVKKRAPVSTSPGGSAGVKKPQTFDDIRRIAGLL